MVAQTFGFFVFLVFFVRVNKKSKKLGVGWPRPLPQDKSEENWSRILRLKKRLGPGSFFLSIKTAANPFLKKRNGSESFFFQAPRVLNKAWEGAPFLHSADRKRAPIPLRTCRTMAPSLLNKDKAPFLLSADRTRAPCLPRKDRKGCRSSVVQIEYMPQSFLIKIEEGPRSFLVQIGKGPNSFLIKVERRAHSFLVQIEKGPQAFGIKIGSGPNPS